MLGGRGGAQQLSAFHSSGVGGGRAPIDPLNILNLGYLQDSTVLMFIGTPCIVYNLF